MQLDINLAYIPVILRPGLKFRISPMRMRKFTTRGVQKSRAVEEQRQWKGVMVGAQRSSSYCIQRVLSVY